MSILFFLYELLSNPKMHLSDMFSNVSTLIVDCVILLPQHSVTTAAQPELMSATFALVAFEFTSPPSQRSAPAVRLKVKGKKQASRLCQSRVMYRAEARVHPELSERRVLTTVSSKNQNRVKSLYQKLTYNNCKFSQLFTLHAILNLEEILALTTTFMNY